MSESLEGIGLFVEVGTVTIEVGTYMTEMDVAMQHLCITILELVIVQIVGMHQKYSFVLYLLARSTFARRLHGKYHGEHDQRHYEQNDAFHYLTQPSYSNWQSR